MDLLFVVGFIIVGYETHYSGIASKFHNGVRGMDGGAVVCEESEKSLTEHTSLWSTCLQNEGG